jgi:hypothetical protein
MRIERSGAIPPLTPRVQDFLMQALSGIEVDSVQSHRERRVDYVCLRGLLAIELKTLEEDGSERMENLVSELRQRDDWPIFLDAAPLEAHVKHMGEQEAINGKIVNRIGRAAVNHLDKAVDQLEAHAKRFPRQNMVRMLILVNEDHEIYAPQTIAQVLAGALHRASTDKPRYKHVDFIVYFTERHAQMLDGRIAFPILIIRGAGVDETEWKADVPQLLLERWAVWNGLPVAGYSDSPKAFDPIDHLPDEAPRHERWRTDYRRNRYLESLTEEALRERFDEIMLINHLAFLKDRPITPPDDIIAGNMECFTHIMMEMSERAIPMTSFPQEAKRLVDAAKRLKLPEPVLEWIARTFHFH